MTRAFSILRSALAGLALAAASVTGAQAAVVQIEVEDVFYGGSDTWEISTVFGTPDALESTLISQPWWGRPNQAREFALVLENQLGTPNSSNTAPYFGYSFAGPFLNARGYREGSFFGPIVGLGIDRGFVAGHFAIAELVPSTSVPLPPAAALLLGGLGMVGVMKRRMRKAA